MNEPRLVKNSFFLAFLKAAELCCNPFLPKQNYEFGNRTIEMHCFASENQTYTGTAIFGVEPLKSLTGQENFLLKNLQLKTRLETI